MYRSTLLSSPLFDMPEFPTLRRMKPLPKRRRMGIDGTDTGSAVQSITAGSLLSAAPAYINAGQEGNETSMLHDPGGLGVAEGEEIVGGDLGNSAAHALFLASLEGLQLPGPDATAEELLAHAETLSARMAMHGYYNYAPSMPMMTPLPGLEEGDCVEDRAGGGAALKAGGGMGTLSLPPLSTTTSPPMGYLDSMASLGAGRYGDGVGMGIGMEEFSDPGMPNIGAGFPLYGMGEVRREDDDGIESGEYIDHLQQPGNTKKRKVPANATRRGYEPGSPHSYSGGDHDTDDVGGGDDSGLLRRPLNADELYNPHESYHHHSGLTTQDAGVIPTAQSLNAIRIGRRGKVSAATLAGLQHKEMLKARKRQLAAVLGALSLGDTLALDQALSTNYPSFGNANGIKELKVRFSRRKTVRMARIARRLGRHPDQVPFPVAEFEFVWPSATADRLIATKEEVAMLRHRFEAELSRQAKKVTKAAANRSATTKGRSGKRAAERAQQRSRKGGDQDMEHYPSLAGTGMATSSATSSTIGPVSGTNKGGKVKKKKRSALANASNPHHLRNYVPSRLPSNSGVGAHGGVNAHAQNLVWPLPVRFLSAEISARRRSGGKRSELAGEEGNGTVGGGLTNPTDEWVCAFCEYSLFYGDEQEYRRAIRNRKKILKRRRKARERAAATSGTKAVKPAGKDEALEDQLEEVQEPGDEDSPAMVRVRQSKLDPTNRDRGGGEQTAYG